VNGDNAVIAWSAGIAGAGLLGKGAVNVKNWLKHLTIQTDLQNKLLFGDPQNPVDYPGLRNISSAVTRLDHGQLEVLRRVDGMQVDLTEGLGRIRRVEKQVTPNGLNSDSIGDRVGRIEKMVAGDSRPTDSRQVTLDEDK
jgi:hypothetical protein